MVAMRVLLDLLLLFLERSLINLAMLVYAKTVWTKRARPATESVSQSGSGDTPTHASVRRKMPRAPSAAQSVATNAASSYNGVRPWTAPVITSIRPYGLDAVSLWPAAAPDDALWQLQITHDAQDSVTKHLFHEMDAFLVDLNHRDPTAPASVRGLETDRGVKMVFTRPDAAEAWIGYRSQRIAFYVAAPDMGGPNYFLWILDSFLLARLSARRAEDMSEFQWQIHAREGIVVDDSALVYPDVRVIDSLSAGAMPHMVTDAWPPSAPEHRSMLQLVLRLEDASCTVLEIL